ncbi:hypothetical protein WJX73_000050 [Symbiochloris irregularis]|uniref:Expansin-like CBD domain-containing protein n=1 Tax=Symbiochloris irregularis TaxID=706552 RepID=A0AAW1NLT8_9CHLO
MAYHGAWHNTAAWLYLSSHGLYGLLWALKSQVFPDKRFLAPAGAGVGLITWSMLSAYWFSPWIIARDNVQPPAWYLGACMASFGVGVFMHFCSDMQKHVQLQLRPGKLVNTTLWAHCRNPNYFGELLIYTGFTALSMHWGPLTFLAAVVVLFWIPQMRQKDKSLSRYPEFAEWKARSSLFIPFVW